MCTSIKFNKRYFGRTLDFERGFGEELIIVPRERSRALLSHNRYAMVGIGVMGDAIPLYFDAVNEWGLCSAALNFADYAVYSDYKDETTIRSSELIAFALGLCRSVCEVRDMLKQIEIASDNKNEDKPSGLHWIFADGKECITVESVKEGLKVYDNPIGVMTNGPGFPYHLTRLADFSSLSAENPESRFTHSPLYSRGMGAIGLPGDFSSSSRFVRAAFIKENLCPNSSPKESLAGFYLDSLAAMSLPRGVVLTDEGEAIKTIYSSLMDMEEPSYHLTTATCRTIKRVSLNDRLILSGEIISLPIYGKENIVDLI